MKNKFIALSFLAVSAVCGLASCGGKSPVGKPGVYFKAASYIITNTGGKNTINAGKSGNIKKTAYADKECAIVTVADEDKLQYGKQDVVITIEPQNFFTFRTYEVDSWVPNGVPAIPYVGLGGPHALYNYPLQKGVAWTFEDQSTAYEVELEEGQPKVTFYKEKYVITVKKEFFQKNIVIDYGNNEDLNNPVYVYNSERYNSLFADPNTLTGDFKNLYTPDAGMSSFIVANKGAYISYRFNSDNAYTFGGFDELADSSNDGEKYYKHFSVKGIKTNKEKVVLSKYDPSKSDDEQLFLPTISNDKKVISFFIDWRLLAEGPEKGYAYIFDNFEVELKKPNTYCGDNEIITTGEGIKVYRGNNGSGFFQHTKDGDILYTHPSLDEPYTTIDDSGNNMKFDRVVIDRDALMNPQATGVTVQYSLLFVVDNKTKPENNNFFKVKVNDYELNLDLKYEKPQHITSWRKAYYTGESNEAELPYWEFGSGNWVLVQLNPKGRTTGLPASIQEKENCYYLYTTNLAVLRNSYMNIDISPNAIPDTATFSTVSSIRSDIGTLEGEEDAGVEKPCVGKNVVELKFNLNAGSGQPAYSVKLNNDKFDATYVPTENGSATILIYTKDPLDTFSANDKVAITELNQEASAVLTDSTRNLGLFSVKAYDKTVLSNAITLPISSKPSFIFDFSGIDPYYVFAKNESIGNSVAHTTSERKITVSLDDNGELNYNATRISESSVQIDVTDTITLEAGKIVNVDIKFMKIEIIEEGTSGLLGAPTGLGNLYEMIGTIPQDPLTFTIPTKGGTLLDYSFTSVYRSGLINDDRQYTNIVDKGGSFDVNITFKDSIPNGTVINVVIKLAQKKG